MSGVDSFFNQSQSHYYLEVLEDSILYSISLDRIELLLAKFHKMETLVRLKSIDMLTKVVNKVNAFQFQTARERYDSLTCFSH